MGGSEVTTEQASLSRQKTGQLRGSGPRKAFSRPHEGGRIESG